ncbi:glutathione S-transferase N-terminal domain-containing protein [bacterium]|nr:glutathione S-transferase N-terminal domain-containing protein [bacterium]
MKIKVYSTPFCPYCNALKNFLKENKVEFEDINVAEDKIAREEMIKKTERMEVPVIEIDNEIIVGFEKEKISRLLKIEK